MKRCQLFVWLFASLIALSVTQAPAHAYVGWSIGVRVGGPVYGQPHPATP